MPRKWIAAGATGLIVLLLALLLIFLPTVRAGLIATLTEVKDNVVGLFQKDTEESPPIVDEPSIEEEPLDEEEPVIEEEPVDEEEPSDEEEELTTELTRANANLEIFLPDTHGDFVIVRSKGEVMLINSSSSADIPKVKTVLDELEIDEVKYIVGGNYHESTIGGMSHMLTYLHPEHMLLARNITINKETQGLMNAIESRDITWTVIGDGSRLTLGDVRVNFTNTHYGGSFIVTVENKLQNFVFTGSTAYFTEKAINRLPEYAEYFVVANPWNIYEFPTEVYKHLNPKRVIINDHPGVSSQKILDKLNNGNLEIIQLNQTNGLTIWSNGVELDSKKGKIRSN